MATVSRVNQEEMESPSSTGKDTDNSDEQTLRERASN